MLSIAVRVVWIEGISEQQVTRDSFAFDLDAAAPLLETIQPPETPREGEDQTTPQAPRQPGRPAAPRPPGTRGDPGQ